VKTLNVFEAEELLRLCRGGRLYDIEKWIAAGKSLTLPTGTRSTPLSIAINNGFHSLAELLARHETQEHKNRALRNAVQEKKWEYVQLLMEHGGDLKSVPLIDALRSWDQRIIRFFLDNGADAMTGSPFAIAFSERIQRALRPFVDYKAEHPELAAQLQQQVDSALRSACAKGDLKWVSLLLWAGGDPRSSGPAVDDDGTNPDDFTTAMHEAAYAENVKVLKRLKPDPTRDDLPSMLRSAAMLSRLDVIRFLLKDLAANPNDKSNGGSKALDSCLTSFGFTALSEQIQYGRMGLKTKASKYSVSKCLDTMRVLLEHGALWRPDDARAINDVRRNLYDCDAEVTLEVITALLKHKACVRESLDALLKTPAIKQHVAGVQRKLGLLGFDVRTAEQKAQEATQKEESRKWFLRSLMSRYDREKIYEEIWAEPMIKVAKRYNISDVGLAKICRKLNIPRPGRGYWEKKEAGKPVPRRPELPSVL
jgi:ankyrin repeat protein